MPAFLAHTRASGASVDFVTTHTYGVDSGFVDEKGKGHTKDAQSWVTVDAFGKSVQVLAWDFQMPDQGNRSNRPYYTMVQPTSDAAPITLALQGMKPGAYSVRIYRTGFRANDAQTAWLEMGKPRTLSAEQVAQLAGADTGQAGDAPGEGGSERHRQRAGADAGE